MSQDIHALISELDGGVSVGKIEYVKQIQSNLEYPVLVIKDFSPHSSKPPISVILGFNPNDLSLPNKIWLNLQGHELVAFNRQMPALKPKYNKINYKNDTYEPYSVNLCEYRFTSEDVRRLLMNLYKHVRPSR